MVRSLALLFLWCAGVIGATAVDTHGGAPPAEIAVTSWPSATTAWTCRTIASQTCERWP